jgi:integrase/recombinase XerD
MDPASTSESPTRESANARSTSSFNWDRLRPFYERSVSEQTRRAYKRVVAEFAQFVGERHPADIRTVEIIKWRDSLVSAKKSASTISLKLSVIRSMFDYLQVGGYVSQNPAATQHVIPPKLPEKPGRRALASKEVHHVLLAPNRETVQGARDYALLLVMLRTGLRVSDICSLRASCFKWSHGRWILTLKGEAGKVRSMPFPGDVKAAIDAYLKLDNGRRTILKTNGLEAYIFQPLVNSRTLVYDKPITPALAWRIVKHWGEFSGVGKLSPHDLRRTAITRALDQGLTYRQVQMMTGHKDPKSVIRYENDRLNMDQNAVNFLNYNED